MKPFLRFYEDCGKQQDLKVLPHSRRSFQVGGSVSVKTGATFAMIEGTKTLSVAGFTPVAVWELRNLMTAEGAGSGLFEQLRLTLRSGAVARMTACFTDFSLWFSLPLSIWLTTGWVGLIFHWQAISKMACQVEKMPADAKPGPR